MAVVAGTFRQLIGGALTDAAEGGTREVVNPASGEVIAVVPDGTAADVDQAVAAAAAARIPFRDTTPAARQELLLALADLVDEHADELKALEIANVGKP